MGDLTKLLQGLLKLLEQLADSPPAIIALLLVIALCILGWRLTVFVVKYTLDMSTKYGHMESIAVGYKVLHDGVSPVQALREIKLELDQFKQ